MKLKLKSLRPYVNIFGEKHQVPYFKSGIGDRFSTSEQNLDVLEAIDSNNPGASRAFSNMMYLQVLAEYSRGKKNEIKTSREVEIDGQKYKISFDDIKEIHILEHEIDGVKYVFRKVPAIEWAKLGSAKHEDILNYCFQHLEYEGKKYKLEDTEEGSLPFELDHMVQEIMGTIRIELPDGSYVTGLEKIEELFITGKI